MNSTFTKCLCENGKLKKSKREKKNFPFSCNPYWQLPNVRNVRRTLGPNFEPLRTSLFCPKPNSEPPEHHKKPNSLRTPDSSFHLYFQHNRKLHVCKIDIYSYCSKVQQSIIIINLANYLQLINNQIVGT